MPRNPLYRDRSVDGANITDAIENPGPLDPSLAVPLRAHSIANLAELRKTVGSIDGNGGPRACMLAGQLTPLDAGAGVYIWDPTSTLADNALQAASAFTVAAVGGVATGRWRRMSTGGGSGITQLTGDGTAGPGSGSQAFTLANIPANTPAAGAIVFKEIAAPGAPAAGKIALYADSTSGNITAKDPFGILYVTVTPKAAVASNWIRSLDAFGGLTASQPAFTDISGAATQAQLPDVVIGIQRIAASGTYTATAGTKSQIVEGWGSGGGGGGTTSVATSEACGGGGAAGGYFRRKYAIVGGGTGTVAIGVAGTAGAATGATGGTGGNTTFTDGVTLCTAFGGLGGVGMTGGSLKTAAGGAAGSISTNGTANATGAPGAPGITLAASVGVSGAGGSCLVGGGGVGSTAQGAGASGTGNGSGGAGGTTVNGGAAVTGGAGTVGVVVITEYA